MKAFDWDEIASYCEKLGLLFIYQAIFDLKQTNAKGHEEKIIA